MVRLLLVALMFLSGCEKMELVHEDNTAKKPITFAFGHVQCPQCHMEVNALAHSVQAVSPDGKTYIFDDVGCFALWVDGRDDHTLVVWAYTQDTHQWIDAKQAFYTVRDDTPMGYGFGAYAQNQEGFVGYEEMKLRMKRGENLTDPRIRKRLKGE